MKTTAVWLAVALMWLAGHAVAADSGEYTLHAPSPLRVEGPAEVRVLEGRGAGELLRFGGPAERGWSNFEIGGFVYERV